MTADPAHIDYVTRLGDNALVLGQRLAEWCGHGPVLEEDLALTNIALDLIGQARLLLAHAGALEGRGRNEDELAFQRDEPDFRNWTLMELPNGVGKHDDYAITITRNFLAGALHKLLWQALSQSSDPELAAIAARATKEAGAHWRHASEWMVRLGDGTELSHQRMQAALDRLWPYTEEFWTPDPIEKAVAAAGIGVATAKAVLEALGVSLPEPPGAEMDTPTDSDTPEPILHDDRTEDDETDRPAENTPEQISEWQTSE